MNLFSFPFSEKVTSFHSGWKEKKKPKPKNHQNTQDCLVCKILSDQKAKMSWCWLVWLFLSFFLFACFSSSLMIDSLWTWWGNETQSRIICEKNCVIFDRAYAGKPMQLFSFSKKRSLSRSRWQWRSSGTINSPTHGTTCRK